MNLDFLLHRIDAWGQLTLVSGAELGLVFVAAAFLPFPRTLLLIMAGMVFGLEALVIIVPCATLGSLLAFIFARFLLRERFVWFTLKYPKLKAISAAVDAEGWRVIAIMRLGVPVPSALQNYLFAMTRIGVTPFIVCTFLFSIPQTALFVYLGSGGRTALSLDQSSLINQVSWVLGIVTTVMLIILIGRHSRRKLSLLAEDL